MVKRVKRDSENKENYGLSPRCKYEREVFEERYEVQFVHYQDYCKENVNKTLNENVVCEFLLSPDYDCGNNCVSAADKSNDFNR